MLILVMVVAILLGGYQAIGRYLRHNATIKVVDSESGILLSQFRYQYRIQTKADRGEMSPWIDAKDMSGEIHLKVPDECTLHVNVEAPDLRAGYSESLRLFPLAYDSDRTLSLAMDQDWYLEGTIRAAETLDEFRYSTNWSG